MRLGILTGGGDCPGLNAVMRAVVVRALRTHEGHVLGFEAKAKNFKSGCCHSVLVALAQQCVPSAYLAFEMGSARLAKRMLGHVGGFNSAMFKHVDEHTISRALEASRALSALPLWFVDCPGMKFSRLRATAAQLTAELARIRGGK